MTVAGWWIAWICACFGFAAVLGSLCGEAAWRRWSSVLLAALALVVPFSIQGGPVLRAAVALELLWVCVKVIGLARERTTRPAWFRVLQLLVLHDLRQDAAATRAASSGAVSRARSDWRPGSLLGACVWGAFAAVALWLALFVAATLPAPWQRLLRCAAGLAFAYTGVEGALGVFEFVYRVCGLRPPIFHQQPILALSIGEFWGRRWNRIVGRWLFATFYRPLALRGQAALGLSAAFVGSALLHLYFTWAAIGLAAGWRMAVFFLAQLPLLFLERWLQQSRWPEPARRLWTLGWLALSSPLFVEPMLDILAGGFAPGVR
ncbi:MAG: MBOAT family protein [Deltaproteobacteria bacterium]